MSGTGKKGGLLRSAADFALAFILFWAVATAFGASQNRAYAIYLPALAKEAIMAKSAVPKPATFRADRPGPVVQSVQTRPEQARVLLSVAFALLAAINLGFWRHLRRVYASPRRSVWRRG